MKNVIITACNAKYGDFVADHWLKSLQANVNLDNIDVVIIDYGLTKAQVKRLKGVILVKRKPCGHVVISRFKDISNYLEDKPYRNILCCDGGDLIFQSDISGFLNQRHSKISIHVEETKNIINLTKLYLNEQYFELTLLEKMKSQENKNELNAGVIFGSKKKMLNLFLDCYNSIKKKTYGPDQLFMTYELYKEGFNRLSCDYNFMPINVAKEFYTKKGSFYFKDCSIIPIVHNAGTNKIFKPISNFGYGTKFNKVRYLYLLVIKLTKIKKNYNLP